MRPALASAFRISSRWRVPTGSCPTGTSSAADLETHLRRERAGRGGGRRRTKAPAVLAGQAECEILRDGEAVDQGEVLVHHADPGVARGAR